MTDDDIYRDAANRALYAWEDLGLHHGLSDDERALRIGKTLRERYAIVSREDLPEVSVDSQDESMMVWTKDVGWRSFSKNAGSARIREEALAMLALSEKLREREEADDAIPTVQLDVDDAELQRMVDNGWMPPRLKNGRWEDRVLNARAIPKVVSYPCGRTDVHAAHSWEYMTPDNTTWNMPCTGVEAEPEREATAAEEDAYEVASVDWGAVVQPPAVDLENMWCRHSWDHDPHRYYRTSVFDETGTPHAYWCDGRVPEPMRTTFHIDNPLEIPREVWDGPVPQAPEGVEAEVEQELKQKRDYRRAFRAPLPEPLRREGDVGTWSHCGNMNRHDWHEHTPIYNEGPTLPTTCNGTP